MDYNTIKITVAEAEKILFDLYGIKGKASSLPGYIDFNFRIKIENEEGYILKICRPDENKKHLEYQQYLLQFIESSDEIIIAPKVITDKNNDSISEITDAFGKKRFVRMLTWVSGSVWSSVNPQLEDFRFSLGEQCGILTKALQSFDHPEAHYNFDWDIAQSLWAMVRTESPDTSPRETSSRSANINACSDRRLTAGRIPPVGTSSPYIEAEWRFIERPISFKDRPL